MKLSIFTFIFLWSSLCFSQINFEKGYFISDANERVECLIKNIDWYNAPTFITYKLDATSEELIGDLKTIKEFQVYNFEKYIRATVKIDKSTNKFNDVFIGTDRNPKLVEETIFLKLLVDGDAQLFSYESEGAKIFFYGENNQKIETLIYKGYFTDNSQIDIKYNEAYKQQLEVLFDCPNFNDKQIQNVDYYNKPLKKLFIKYNQCLNPNFKNNEINNSSKKNQINLSLKPRISSASSIIKRTNESYYFDLGNKTTTGFGIELEYILPFNKNKWSIFLEPAFQYYNGEKTKPQPNISGGTLTTTVDFKSVELPLGIRHYFYLNDNSKIFVNALISYDFSLNSSVKITRADKSVLFDLETENTTKISYGAGYKYKKISAEIRLNPTRDLLNDYLFFYGNINTVSLIFGYTLF